MSEKEIADQIGAELVKNSGRGRMKGDMKYHCPRNKYIVDAKEGKSFSLTQEVWAKIRADAMQHGINWQPMILRKFPDGTMVVVIDFYLLEDLEYTELGWNES
jgi:hypothetical protein